MKFWKFFKFFWNFFVWVWNLGVWFEFFVDCFGVFTARNDGLLVILSLFVKKAKNLFLILEIFRLFQSLNMTNSLNFRHKKRWVLFQNTHPQTPSAREGALKGLPYILYF